MSRAGLVLFSAFIAVCALVCVARLQVSTSLDGFWISVDDRESAEVVRALTQSPLARTMVFALHGEPDAAPVDAAEALAHALADHPEVAWVRDRVDPAAEAAAYDLYFPRRLLFASDRPEVDLRERFSDEGLAAAAAALRRELLRPTGALTKRIAPTDPWLLFVDRLEALRGAAPTTVDVRDGRFVTTDGRHALVMLASRHSPMASEHATPLEADIERTVADVEARFGVTVQRSAVHRFAVQSERAIRADVERISVVSSLGVVALFMLAFRSVRVLALVFAPLVAGVVAAAGITTVVFGEVHGLTLAFGATLIGVCVDYPCHLLADRAASSDTAAASLRRVWPGLVLGATTTIVGFAGLSWTSLPGVRQIGVFASVGVAVALLATRIWLPVLLPAAQNARGLGALIPATQRFVAGLTARRRLLALPILAALGVAALGLPRAQWVDDASALNRLQPSALAEDERVRALVERAGVSRLVVARGETLEQALQANDEAYLRLQQAGGELRIRSLHALLWSAHLQTRNADVVRSMPDLAGRTVRALAAQGFDPAAFGGLASQTGDLPQPLTMAELADSPLGPVAEPYRLAVDEGAAIATFVDGDPARIRDALEGLASVSFFDQGAFVARTYGAYRRQTTGLVLAGLVAVFLVLFARYRSVPRTLAAWLPAVAAAAATAGTLALAGVELNIVHLLGLLLVLSMGVDYGVFLAEARGDAPRSAATLLGLVVACLSTVLGFGLLAVSSNPALSAIGSTTALGVALSLALAPSALLLVRSGGGRA